MNLWSPVTGSDPDSKADIMLQKLPKSPRSNLSSFYVIHDILCITRYTFHINALLVIYRRRDAKKYVRSIDFNYV